jgi:hypothetical protein
MEDEDKLTPEEIKEMVDFTEGMLDIIRERFQGHVSDMIKCIANIFGFIYANAGAGKESIDYLRELLDDMEESFNIMNRNDRTED